MQPFVVPIFFPQVPINCPWASKDVPILLNTSSQRKALLFLPKDLKPQVAAFKDTGMVEHFYKWGGGGLTSYFNWGEGERLFSLIVSLYFFVKIGGRGGGGGAKALTVPSRLCCPWDNFCKW